jgi:hypothetical protein
MNKLRQLFSKKPYLAWYVKDAKNISPESMLEHILNYGDWEDYLVAEKSIGINRARKIFDKLKSKSRSNLRAKTINYFEKYYQRYA